jgi:hypothetical protein
MKIEFEIEDSDLAVLLQALESAAASAANRTSFDALQRLVNEIRQDITNGTDVFLELKTRLTSFTNGSPILPKSNFRTHLGMSLDFIESENGLLHLLNWILDRLVRANKPRATTKLIESDDIEGAFIVQDLVKLITDNYVASA